MQMLQPFSEIKINEFTVDFYTLYNYYLAAGYECDKQPCNIYEKYKAVDYPALNNRPVLGWHHSYL